ncbi:hypothetical protein V6N13_020763 [Hibiscus sabdariffa]
MGWVEDVERFELDDNKVAERFPGIPSLPLPLESAQLILESLRGPLASQGWRDSFVPSWTGSGYGEFYLRVGQIEFAKPKTVN